MTATVISFWEKEKKNGRDYLTGIGLHPEPAGLMFWHSYHLGYQDLRLLPFQLTNYPSSTINHNSPPGTNTPFPTTQSPGYLGDNGRP